MTTTQEQRRPYCEPTGPVNVPRLLAIAATLGVPVARWVDGRCRFYRAGVEVEGWTPWPR